MRTIRIKRKLPFWDVGDIMLDIKVIERLLLTQANLVDIGDDRKIENLTQCIVGNNSLNWLLDETIRIIHVTLVLVCHNNLVAGPMW